MQLTCTLRPWLLARAGLPVEGAFSRNRSFRNKLKKYGTFVPRGQEGPADARQRARQEREQQQQGSEQRQRQQARRRSKLRDRW